MNVFINAYLCESPSTPSHHICLRGLRPSHRGRTGCDSCLTNCITKYLINRNQLRYIANRIKWQDNEALESATWSGHLEACEADGWSHPAGIARFEMLDQPIVVYGMLCSSDRLGMGSSGGEGEGEGASLRCVPRAGDDLAPKVGGWLLDCCIYSSILFCI